MSFHEGRPQSAFLKAGIFGEAGSGKTFTSTKVAIGLHRYIKSDEPIFIMDTETGSDFLLERIKNETGKLPQVDKTRAFSDLISNLDKMLPGSILIIDSLTHFWSELIDSYLKKKQKVRLSLPDWQPLKGTWREFTDRYVNLPIHIIWAARSADRWEEVEDDDGAKELKKVGTKARTETQMAYEPSLLVEMELIQASARIGGKLLHRAHVRKDRFDIINGQHFDDPGFEAFMPHITKLNLGGEHIAIETDRNSQDIFNDPNIGERKALHKEILCEKITNEIKKLYPAQSEKDKAERVKLLEEVFGTNSWTEISTLMKNDKLEAGLALIEQKVFDAFKPSDPAPAPIPASVPDNGGNSKPKAKGARA